MTFKTILFISLTCLFAGLHAAAQQATFTASDTSGCSPLTVSFTNTSTGFSSSATYEWTFGNTNSSTLQDPGTTYQDEGEYIVTLTVKDGAQTSSIQMTITVYKKPVVDFSVDVTKGCEPLAVTFTSNSIPGDGTISSYTWDFGDGMAEKGEGVQPHIYNTAKKVSPSLTVTNSYGCYSTFSKKDLIEVLPAVHAGFKPNRTVLCNIQSPLTVTNTTAGTGTLTYLWDFGDNSTSSQPQPPQHTYAIPGSYPVKLTVTSANGCTSDSTIIINAADYHADFSVSSPLCQNTEAVFINTSTPTPTSENWLIKGFPFSDTVSGQLHHTFDAPGNYQVQLNTVFETCPAITTKQITVLPSPSSSGFIARVEGGCGAPVDVTFIDTAVNTTGWQWDFSGDGTATGSGQQTTYQYTENGTYTAILKRTNAAGCSVLVSQPVVIGKARVEIESSEGNLGCDSLRTIFSALSQEPIAQYNWTFSDDGSFSTEANPEHLFATVGNFTATLKYVTKGGCVGESKYAVNIYARPQFDFTAINTNVCGSTPVGFEVTGINTVGTYYWNYGDSGKYVISNIAPYSHQYQQDSLFDVSLIIDNHTCRDTVTREDYLTVVPPFPHITTITNTCSGDRGLVTIADTSRKADGWSWDFGDNSPPLAYSPARSQVQHQYNQSGHYIVTLTTTNGACSAIDTASVYVLMKQQPLLSSSMTTFCGSDTFRTAIGSLDNNPYTGTGLGYTVTSVLYGDGSLFGGIVSLPDSISQSGFGVNLININPEQTKLRIVTKSEQFGCADTTAYISFQALGPVAGFSVKENNVCFKTPVVFTDQSRPTHNSPIVKWNWQFGDSTSQVNVQSTSVSHLYPEPGTFSAMLTVTDAKGCSAFTAADAGFVIVKGPKAVFSVSANQVLPQTDVQFYNQTNTLNTNSFDNKYTWLFGDGSTLKNQNYIDSVTHSYAAESIDTVTLIATNAVEHCADTTSQVVYVRNPNLSFTYTTTYINPDGGCPPVIANFISTSKNTIRIKWNFGDGRGVIGEGETAGLQYNTPGVYKVTLYGYFLDGTMDSVFEMVTIKGPYASLSAVKPFACGAELITLKATSANSRNFTWDFGDGTVISNTDTFATHRYLTPNIYRPSLIVSDGSNCKFAYFPDKPIIIDTLKLGINKQSKIACDSTRLFFTPTTYSLAKDSLQKTITYHWDFGTGNARDTANTENSSFVYNTPATYEVILSGASPYGCTDITRDLIVVQPTPKAFVAGTTTICEGDTATFTATATRDVTWLWNFVNGNTSAEQNPLPQVYTKPGLDSVSLIVNDNGCFDTAWHALTVHAKPDINPSPLSAHLCQSDSVQLQAHDGTLYQWTPAMHISGANTAMPFVYPDTAVTYHVTVTNAAGCVSNDSVSITVTPRFTVVAPSPFYICPDSSVRLSATGADSYHWLNDNLSDPDIATPTVTDYETKTYKVVGSDRYGCFTDTTTTQVLTAPLPIVDAGKDIITFAGTDVVLNASGSPDIARWQWTTPDYLACDTCPNTVLTAHANLQYVMKVTSRGGCVSYDSLQVTILCKAARINVPSAFTPNGDGRNDYFTVVGRGVKEIQHFAVFDRYGNILFERSHLPVSETGFDGWNGTYKGKLMPAGTYVYIAEVVCDTGDIFPYKGTVVLIR